MGAPTSGNFPYSSSWYSLNVTSSIDVAHQSGFGRTDLNVVVIILVPKCFVGIINCVFGHFAKVLIGFGVILPLIHLLM